MLADSKLAFVWFDALDAEESCEFEASQNCGSLSTGRSIELFGMLRKSSWLLPSGIV